MSGHKANKRQVGGSHYKQFRGHEPWDVITAWGLGYLDGTAVKYLSRWRHKNGLQDLEKAKHFLEKLIEVEKQREKELAQTQTGPAADRGEQAAP